MVCSGVALVALNALIYALGGHCIVFYIFLALSIAVYIILINFFRCPIRFFEGDTEGIVVAPADGKVVVAEEVVENEYFHEPRIMISIFMSLLDVHANWFPVDGFVKSVTHQKGNFHKAWLPKASIENERSSIVVETPNGQEVLVRQIAGALARRIVSYAQPLEECYIDEHLGFIKLGSRVDVFLPLGSEVLVKPGQKTVGDVTVIAKISTQHG